MAAAPKPIDPEALGSVVTGVNLMPGSLGQQLGDEPTLLAFLRRDWDAVPALATRLRGGG